jgi:hypothetical protein
MGGLPAWDLLVRLSTVYRKMFSVTRRLQRSQNWTYCSEGFGRRLIAQNQNKWQTLMLAALNLGAIPPQG